MRLFVAGIRKLRRRPATYVTFGLLVGLLALIYLAVGATAQQQPTAEGRESALTLLTFPGAYSLLLSFILGLGGLFAMVYGAAIAGSEWSWGTLKSAVARGESRSRYQLLSFASIGLLVGIGLLLAFVIGILVALLAGAIAGVGTEGAGDSKTLGTLPELLGRGWLALLETAAIGYTIATLARSQLAGIGVGIGLFFAESFASHLPPRHREVRPVQCRRIGGRHVRQHRHRTVRARPERGPRGRPCLARRRPRRHRAVHRAGRDLGLTGPPAPIAGAAQATARSLLASSRRTSLRARQRSVRVAASDPSQGQCDLASRVPLGGHHQALPAVWSGGFEGEVEASPPLGREEGCLGRVEDCHVEPLAVCLAVRNRRASRPGDDEVDGDPVEPSPRPARVLPDLRFRARVEGTIPGRCPRRRSSPSCAPWQSLVAPPREPRTPPGPARLIWAAPLVRTLAVRERPHRRLPLPTCSRVRGDPLRLAPAGRDDPNLGVVRAVRQIPVVAAELEPCPVRGPVRRAIAVGQPSEVLAVSIDQEEPEPRAVARGLSRRRVARRPVTSLEPRGRRHPSSGSSARQSRHRRSAACPCMTAQGGPCPSRAGRIRSTTAIERPSGDHAGP